MNDFVFLTCVVRIESWAKMFDWCDGGDDDDKKANIFILFSTISVHNLSLD